MYSLKDPSQVRLKGLGAWGIPELDPTKFMSFKEIPEGLDTWAGYATREDVTPDRWWFFNWGSERTRGMADISKVVLGFYSFDTHFDGWFDWPDTYLAKVLNSKIKYAVTPDFSMNDTDPAAVWLWSLYRSRWVGRYMQDGGLKIIPDVLWPGCEGGIDFLEKHVAPTLPKKLPCIAMEIQNFDKKDIARQSRKRDGLQAVFDLLQPQGVLLYAAQPGRDLFESAGYTGKVHMLETRLEKIGRTKTGRTRSKSTIA